jgi:magnesium transporter
MHDERGAAVTIIDNAVYVNGHRTADPEGLEETYFVLRQRQGMAWIGLYRPDAGELRSVADEFDLNHLAVEDALAGHQRAKLEHYGETLFLACPAGSTSFRGKSSCSSVRPRR